MVEIFSARDEQKISLLFLFFQNNRLNDAKAIKKVSENELLIHEYKSKSSKWKISALNTLKGFSCEFCGYKTASRKDLNCHMQTKHQNGEMTCNICIKHFDSIFKMRNHMYQYHSNKAIHKCEICYSDFNWYKSLHDHVEKRHLLDEKKIISQECDICGVQFYTKKRLQSHMGQKHFGPYECYDKSCKIRFQQPTSRRNHYLIYHNCDPVVSYFKSSDLIDYF